MKKVYLFLFVSLMIIGLTGCQGGQSGKTEKVEEPEPEPIDYAALVEEELPSITDFETVVKNFQKRTSELMPTGKVWSKGETEIREMLEPKGFTVESDADRFFISAEKNCKFEVKEENYIYSYSIDSVKPEGVAAAYYFECMGDFYVKGEILLADTCVYDVLMEKIKEANYSPVDNEFPEAEDEVKFAKEDYYFLCSRKENRIGLHKDINMF